MNRRNFLKSVFGAAATLAAWLAAGWAQRDSAPRVDDAFQRARIDDFGGVVWDSKEIWQDDSFDSLAYEFGTIKPQTETLPDGSLPYRYAFDPRELITDEYFLAFTRDLPSS